MIEQLAGQTNTPSRLELGALPRQHRLNQGSGMGASHKMCKAAATQGWQKVSQGLCCESHRVSQQRLSKQHLTVRPCWPSVIPCHPIPSCVFSVVAYVWWYRLRADACTQASRHGVVAASGARHGKWRGQKGGQEGVGRDHQLGRALTPLGLRGREREQARQFKREQSP